MLKGLVYMVRILLLFFKIVLYSSKYFIIQNFFEKGRDFCGHLENHTIRAHSCYLTLGSDNYSSVSEEERDNSRPPMWSKYPLDVQKEFDYDSPHDLDSD